MRPADTLLAAVYALETGGAGPGWVGDLPQALITPLATVLRNFAVAADLHGDAFLNPAEEHGHAALVLALAILDGQR